MRPPEDVKKEIVRQWLAKAEQDMNAGDALLAAEPPFLYPACFHAQQAAEKLFKQFEEDGMAVWMYSRALLDFRKYGDFSGADKSLKAALDENKHVPSYLLGRKKMPRTLPGHHGFGDDNEAVLYVYGNKAAWKATPGAMEWLAAKVK